MGVRASFRVASAIAAALLAASAAAGPPPERAVALRAAAAVQARHADALLDTPGVVGVGRALGADGAAEIRVFTARPGVAGIPRALEGVRVRARVSGRFYAHLGPTCDASGDGVCGPDERWPRPVPIGVSIGHPSITAGTLGVRVTDGTQRFVLSNNHVLAASNLAQIGDAALQPGTFDGGSQAQGDAVGTLHDFEPIAFCDVIFPFYACPTSNAFDAAVALTTAADVGFATPDGAFGSTPGYGVPNPQLHPAYGDPAVIGDEVLANLLQSGVRKYGRTTGATAGTVGTIGVTVDVCYDALCEQIARFADQLSIPHTSGAFSAGGDSGSLVVSDDGLHHPVGLLFAGSDTDTLVSRIDLVLARFGVAIDDGGATLPRTDAALTALEAPSWAQVDQTVTLPVTVRNAGNQPLAPFDVALDDQTEGTRVLLAAPALDPGEEFRLDFSWTPRATGDHVLAAALQLADDEPANDVRSATVPVLLEPPGVSLFLWEGTARTDAWTRVDLPSDYGPDMVPVCTPRYDAAGLGPLVPRVRNAQGTSFEVGLGRPWFGAFPGEETAEAVHCLVVRQGVYDEPGFRLEAVRLEGFSGKDDAFAWVGTPRSYAQDYVQPVVLGQVVSAGAGPPGEIGVWSSFWARGASAFQPPSPDALFVGRHTGEDPGVRPPETLVYVVLEARTGRLDGVAYEAGVSAEVIAGVDDAPPYAVPLSGYLESVSGAVLGSAGMDGLEGGWPIFYGAGAVDPAALGLAIDEDWYFDPERVHTAEQAAYLVLGSRSRHCGLGAELAFLVPALAGLRSVLRSRRRIARRP